MINIYPNSEKEDERKFTIKRRKTTQMDFLIQYRID